MNGSLTNLLERGEELLSTPGSQTASLLRMSHRPWPLPSRRWLMAQTWQQLLFAHWRVPAEQLRRLIPPHLVIDTYDGDAWIGITPFVVTGFRLRGTPPIPLLSQFYEANVRTYVTFGDRPGVWFFTLDASRPDVVLAARAAYHLPYRHASVHKLDLDGAVDWRSHRRSDGGTLRARYRPTGPVSAPEPGSLEAFLTERYRLYTTHEGRLHHADIHHAPWPLQQAEADVQDVTIAPVELRDALSAEPVCHYAARQDVLIWPLTQSVGR
jgi:uncharacterized protein